MIELVDGATGPPIAITFTRPGPDPRQATIIDLTGATVVATVARPGLTSLTKEMSIINPTEGSAQIQWVTGDIVCAGPEAVYYEVDFAITNDDGTEIQPVPLQILVRPGV